MRDHFPEIAEQMEEVEQIRMQEHRAVSNHSIRTVYIWTTKPAVPSFVENFLRPEMLSWTDTAHWDEARHQCSWRIFSHYFREGMDCEGETSFEPALGGRGSRLTFTGGVRWKEGALSGLGGLASKSLEPVLNQLVTSNFRKIGGAVEQFLTRE